MLPPRGDPNGIYLPVYLPTGTPCRLPHAIRNFHPLIL